jgi:hypothetical protein
MSKTKSRRNIRSKRVLSRKNRSRKNRNSRRMKGGDPDNFLHIPNMGIKSALGRIPNMGIKRALGLDRESRLNSQERAVQKSYSGLPSMPVEAWNKNEDTLCEYQELLNRYKDKKPTKKEFEDFEQQEANLMLYRFQRSDTYPLSEYPNPMSVRDIINTPRIQFLYIDKRMKCSASVFIQKIL